MAAMVALVVLGIERSPSRQPKRIGAPAARQISAMLSTFTPTVDFEPDLATRIFRMPLAWRRTQFAGAAAGMNFWPAKAGID